MTPHFKVKVPQSGERLDILRRQLEPLEIDLDGLFQFLFAGQGLSEVEVPFRVFRLQFHAAAELGGRLPGLAGLK